MVDRALVPIAGASLCVTVPAADDLVAAWLVSYRGSTREAYRRDLADFTAWCAGAGLPPLAVTRAHAELYSRDL